jgi:hypothetical protein
MNEISDNSSTSLNNKKYLIDIRREKVLEFASQNLTQHEIQWTFLFEEIVLFWYQMEFLQFFLSL